jgi:hypothetical protein
VKSGQFICYKTGQIYLLLTPTGGVDSGNEHRFLHMGAAQGDAKLHKGTPMFLSFTTGRDLVGDKHATESENRRARGAASCDHQRDRAAEDISIRL